MNWYLEVLKKYAVFKGRAQRAEFWYFALFNIIISIVLGMIDTASGSVNPQTGTGLLGGIYMLAVFIPGIAVSVRRLHDTDRSGWWMLIAFVPMIGFLVLLVFMVFDSQPEQNQYGSSPKAAVT